MSRHYEYYRVCKLGLSLFIDVPEKGKSKRKQRSLKLREVVHLFSKNRVPSKTEIGKFETYFVFRTSDGFQGELAIPEGVEFEQCLKPTESEHEPEEKPINKLIIVEQDCVYSDFSFRYADGTVPDLREDQVADILAVPGVCDIPVTDTAQLAGKIVLKFTTEAVMGCNITCIQNQIAAILNRPRSKTK